jgi:hypothetical protein
LAIEGLVALRAQWSSATKIQRRILIAVGIAGCAVFSILLLRLA